MPPSVTLIGVDCATNPTRVGLALGALEAERARVERVQLASRAEPPVDVIAQWAARSGRPALIALDAPLGWPAPLGDVIQDHRAGDAIGADAHALFRRATDRSIRDRLGKQSLDVGADRIARTAHAALGLLGALRQRLGVGLPLHWGGPVVGVQAVEVYPAATLRAFGIDATGYKRRDGTPARRRVLGRLRKTMDIPDLPLLTQSDDVLDAVVCLLAAADVVGGAALSPDDRALAEREGWIWVRDPATE